MIRKAPAHIRVLAEQIIPFPEPQPSFVALLLLLGLWPGGIDMAWKVGRWSLTKPLCNAGKFFVHAVVCVCAMVRHLFSALQDVGSPHFFLNFTAGILFTIGLYVRIPCP